MRFVIGFHEGIEQEEAGLGIEAGGVGDESLHRCQLLGWDFAQDGEAEMGASEAGIAHEGGLESFARGLHLAGFAQNYAARVMGGGVIGIAQEEGV